MKLTLFPFQRKALEELHIKSINALRGYSVTNTPQVVSFTAPTGSGKTIVMTALMENIFYGND